MSIVTEKRLKDRSGGVCEISGSDENLVVYLYYLKQKPFRKTVF
jgi:hypothetical protein